MQSKIVEREFICFALNGQILEISGEDLFLTAAEFFRIKRGLTGTKVVCAEGDCGACTVLKARANAPYDQFEFIPVNSCIIPVFALDGCSVVTVEGIELGHELHPVQTAMVDFHGSQCGYCTPGFVCSMTAMAESLKVKHKKITEKRARNYLTGNLCRCTGYKDILNAACSVELDSLPLLKERYGHPDLLDKLHQATKTVFSFRDSERRIAIATSWDRALQLKNDFKNMKVVAGLTDVGVLRNKGKDESKELLSIQLIPELKVVQKIEMNKISIGASVTLAEFEKYIDHHVPVLKNLLHIFASPQIKNQGTVIGNIINGSPIGDLIPFFVNQKAHLVLHKFNQTTQAVSIRRVMLQDFYRGYKDIDLDPSEIAHSLECQLPAGDEVVKLYKVSLRKDLDISVVTMAGNIVIDKQNKITAANFTFGGVGPIVKIVEEIGRDLLGQPFTENKFLEVGQNISHYVHPISDLRGSAEYRLGLCQQLLLKYFIEVEQDLATQGRPS